MRILKIDNNAAKFFSLRSSSSITFTINTLILAMAGEVLANRLLSKDSLYFIEYAVAFCSIIFLIMSSFYITKSFEFASTFFSGVDTEAKRQKAIASLVARSADYVPWFISSAICLFFALGWLSAARILV